jgi:hypothetical protein
MGLMDVLAEVSADKKAKGKSDVRYVSFKITEWDEMESKFGKKLDPVDVKKLVQGIFLGRFNVVSAKPKA